MKLINLPNIITCCNVLCGCMAVFFGLNGEVGLACLCIILGAVFDFFDGMTARALHISSPIGKELDSLADMVTFGVAPSVLAYHICCTLQGVESGAIAFLLSSLIAAFSALRLAKFNCDERQHLSFIGLPTPANALFWIGLSQFIHIPSVSEHLRSSAYFYGWVLIVVIIVMCYLLISELPMFSLKLKPGHNGFAENRTRYIFLAITAVLLVTAACFGVIYLLSSAAVIILLYILLSVIDLLTSHKN